MPNLFLILVSLVCVLIIGSAIYKYYWTRRALYKFANKLMPGPKTVVMYRNLFFCKNEDFFNVFNKLMAPFSSPVPLWLGLRLVVYLKSAEHLQAVMQSSKISTKCYLYKFTEPLLGQGLLTGSGEAFRNSKKEYQVFFTQKMLETYSHLFGEYAVKCVEEMKCCEHGDKFNIFPYFINSSFESFMDILVESDEFDYNGLENPRTVTLRIQELFFERFVSFWLHPDLFYKQTKAYKTQKCLNSTIRLFVKNVIKRKIPEITERMEKLEANKNCKRRAPSMIELLIEKRKGNLNSVIEKTEIDNIISLIAANQDTQSAAMSFTCMLLGMFPKIQDKVYAEVIEVLDGRKIVDFTDASNLKYLDMCIKETLRLFPSIPFVLRDTTENFQLEADLVIPENVSVVLSIFDVHRDPKHWERPNDFYPEHFTPESVAKRHPYAFVPFSAGPRKCIGQQFAYTNMKIMLATILLNYVIESEEKFEDIKLKVEVIIRPINGYSIKIRKRTAA